MRFSYILSAFLATFAIASPVPSATKGREVTEDKGLVARATIVDTEEYKTAIAAHSGLVKDNYYWFTLEWPLGTPVGDGDAETQTELQQLQKKLGFEHIGIVVGQITETTTGKGANQKTTRDFKATLLHMTKKNVTPGTTELKSPNYKADSKQTLKWGAQTTAKKVAAAKKEGKTYVTDHGIYAIDGNNCNDFVKDVKKTL